MPSLQTIGGSVYVLPFYLTHPASLFFVLMAALIFLLSLAGFAAAQGNTSLGIGALQNNSTVSSLNTASGVNALVSNTMGDSPSLPTCLTGNLNNATAIGFGATVNVSNKIRLGNNAVTVIEGTVAFTAVSTKTQKENFHARGWRRSAGKDSRL